MIHKIFFAFRVTLLTLATPVLGYEAAPIQEEVICKGNEALCRSINKEEKNAIRLFAKIIKSLHERQDDSIWPGYDIASSPTIIHFPSGNIFAFDLNAQDPHWTSLELGGYNVQFSKQDYWNISDVAMHFNFPISGKQAFVFKVDLSRAALDHPHRVFIHERFHRHQIEKFANGERFGPYVDHINPRNLELVQIEEQILVDFFNTQERAKRLEILKNFLAVNKTRKGLIDPNSWASEMHQQKIEGLADYASLKTLDAFKILEGFSGEKFLRETIQGYAKSQEFSDRTIKWRHYGVGAGLGYALDFLEVPHWKERVVAGETLVGLLENHLLLNEREVASRVEKVKKTYHFHQVHQKVEGCVIDYQDHISRLFKAFDEQEGIVINVGKPHVSVSAGGMNADLLYLADGSTLSVKDTTSITSDDTFWRMKLEEMEFIFLNAAGIRKFKTTDDLEVTLDGKRYKGRDLLRRGIRKPFQTVTLKSKNCDFVSERHQGELVVEDHQIHIRYKN
jgi:hypothetical protein